MLTPDVTTGIGARADIEVVRAMRFGRALDDAPLCASVDVSEVGDGG